MKIAWFFLFVGIGFGNSAEARLSCETLFESDETLGLEELDPQIEELHNLVLNRSPIQPAEAVSIAELRLEILNPFESPAPRLNGASLKRWKILERLSAALRSRDLDDSWLKYVELENPYHLERLKTLFYYEPYDIFLENSFTNVLLRSRRSEAFFKIYFENTFIFNSAFYSHLSFSPLTATAPPASPSQTLDFEVKALSGKVLLDFLREAKSMQEVFDRLSEIEKVSDKIHWGFRTEAFSEEDLPTLNLQRLRSEAIRIEAILDHLYFHVFRHIQNQSLNQFIEDNYNHFYEIHYYIQYRDNLLLGFTKNYIKKAQFFHHLFDSFTQKISPFDQDLRSLTYFPVNEEYEIPPNN